MEIDLILEHPQYHKILIEIKSTNKIDERHIRSIKQIVSSLPENQYLAYCFSNDPVSKIIEGIKVVHWEAGLKELGF